MKIKNYFFTYLFIVISGTWLLISGCSKDDDPNPQQPKNLVEVASADPQFSTLVQALGKANLAVTLQGKGPFTVFAPTNQAFEQLFTQLGVSGVDALTAEQLTPILLYHVISGKITSSQLQSGYVSTLSPGAGGLGLSLAIDAANKKLNGNIGIIATDLEASNGIIHGIDKVLLPPSLVDIALANGNFSTLVSAVVKANLAGALSASGSITVFAPTNAAFNQLFSQLGVSGIDALSAEALTPILLYHVLGTAVKSSSLQNGYVNTLCPGPNASAVSLQIEANRAKLNGNVSITLTDIVATNGIIHVIDKVLLPPSVVDLALSNGNFSILVSALVKSELVDVLKGAGPFTIFAPSNDAFNALFAQLGVSGINDLTKEQITPILLDHVVSGNLQSSQLSSGSVQTLNNSITITVGNGVVINGTINVVLADVQGTNGVIHVVDKVIITSDK